MSIHSSPPPKRRRRGSPPLLSDLPGESNAFSQCITSSQLHSLPSHAPFSTAMELSYDEEPASRSSMRNYSDKKTADTIPDRSGIMVGVKSISVGDAHSLLLTYSGDVYGWGYNYDGQVLYNGPQTIKSPIKSSLKSIISISAGAMHSLALCSDGQLYGWGWNRDNQINMSSFKSLPITPINVPYNIKQVYGSRCSFALTHEGQVIKWGNGKSFKLIKGLNNIVFISMIHNSFVAIDRYGYCYLCNLQYSLKLSVTKYTTPMSPFEGSIPLVYGLRGGRYRNTDYLLITDNKGDVWQFQRGNNQNDPFNNKPIRVSGLTNIVSITGNNCCVAGNVVIDVFYAALDNSGKVFVWGELSRISEFYEYSDEPRCIEAFTNIEGISVGINFLFAYNKSTVWAWGRNDKGQLGTGDLIDRPQPVKVFGSEILGTFHYPKQPLDRMFSVLIKLVYWEYLNYLQKLFGNHPYVKAKFYTKCGISKRVAQFAQEVFNVHPIQNKMFLKDPQDLNLNENICDLHLQLSTDYIGLKVINTRIKQLDVYYDEVDYDPQFLSFFPNVEVVKLGGRCRFGRNSINLVHLSHLKCLELDFEIHIEKLPTSLVKLVLKNDLIQVADLSYLPSLNNLVPSIGFSEGILKGQLHLPQSIIRLELLLIRNFNIQMQLPNLKEFIIERYVPTNITEQNFPSLKFIQLIKFDKDSLVDSSISPTTFINRVVVKSVQLIKNEYLVELSCFPWWIQYPAEKFIIESFYTGPQISTKPKKRCGLCRALGHNKRTCPQR
ncbi:hypothetical protein P9112_006264 [Eukaryota sp. TZLM1-RC]